MSSTITETESRSIPTMSEISAMDILKKRENFARSGSIEKLKKFNSFICSQHFYILPGILFWLRTSKTILASNVEKSMLYLKSMFLISIIHQENRLAGVFKLTSKDIIDVLSFFLIKTSESLVIIYGELKKIVLRITIYLSVALVICQMIAVIGLLFYKIPPLGFVFLVCCVLYMGRIASIVMIETKQKQRTVENETKETNKKITIHKRLSFMGKTISNVKLF